MYPQQTQRQQSSAFFNASREPPRASSANLFNAGLAQRSPVNAMSQYSFDSFINDAPPPGPMSLPHRSTAPPQSMTLRHRSGPRSLENTNATNPFRSNGRRGHSAKVYQSAGSLFGPAPNQSNDSLFGGSPQIGNDGFALATFEPSQPLASNSAEVFAVIQPPDYTSEADKEVEFKVDMIDMATLSVLNDKDPDNYPENCKKVPGKFDPIGKKFSQYKPSEISQEKIDKAVKETAEKVANREKNLTKINEKRAKLLEQQKENWAKITKEKEQEELLKCFQNVDAPLTLVQKPKSKEERKSIRERAKKARLRKSERPGDLSSLIDEISSQTPSLCSDLSEQPDGAIAAPPGSQNVLQQQPILLQSNSHTHDSFKQQQLPAADSSSSFGMLTQKSSENESRLSPYQVIDGINYPLHSPEGSSTSSPLEIIQNVSVASSTYEKIGMPSSTSSASMDVSSFEITDIAQNVPSHDSFAAHSVPSHHDGVPSHHDGVPSNEQSPDYAPSNHNNAYDQGAYNVMSQNNTIPETAQTACQRHDNDMSSDPHATANFVASNHSDEYDQEEQYLPSQHEIVDGYVPPESQYEQGSATANFVPSTHHMEYNQEEQKKYVDSAYGNTQQGSYDNTTYFNDTTVAPLAQLMGHNQDDFIHHQNAPVSVTNIFPAQQTPYHDTTHANETAAAMFTQNMDHNEGSVAQPHDATSQAIGHQAGQYFTYDNRLNNEELFVAPHQVAASHSVEHDQIQPNVTQNYVHVSANDKSTFSNNTQLDQKVQHNFSESFGVDASENTLQQNQSNEETFNGANDHPVGQYFSSNNLVIDRELFDAPHQIAPTHRNMEHDQIQPIETHSYETVSVNGVPSSGNCAQLDHKVQHTLSDSFGVDDASGNTMQQNISNSQISNDQSNSSSNLPSHLLLEPDSASLTHGGNVSHSSAPAILPPESQAAVNNRLLNEKAAMLFEQARQAVGSKLQSKEEGANQPFNLLPEQHREVSDNKTAQLFMSQNHQASLNDGSTPNQSLNMSNIQKPNFNHQNEQEHQAVENRHQLPLQGSILNPVGPTLREANVSMTSVSIPSIDLSSNSMAKNSFQQVTTNVPSLQQQNVEQHPQQIYPMPGNTASPQFQKQNKYNSDLNVVDQQTQLHVSDNNMEQVTEKCQHASMPPTSNRSVPMQQPSQSYIHASVPEHTQTQQFNPIYNHPNTDNMKEHSAQNVQQKQPALSSSTSSDMSTGLYESQQLMQAAPQLVNNVVASNLPNAGVDFQPHPMHQTPLYMQPVAQTNIEHTSTDNIANIPQSSSSQSMIDDRQVVQTSSIQSVVQTPSIQSVVQTSSIQSVVQGNVEYNTVANSYAGNMPPDQLLIAGSQVQTTNQPVDDSKQVAAIARDQSVSKDHRPEHGVSTIAQPAVVPPTSREGFAQHNTYNNSGYPMPQQPTYHPEQMPNGQGQPMPPYGQYPGQMQYNPQQYPGQQQHYDPQYASYDMQNQMYWQQYQQQMWYAGYYNQPYVSPYMQDYSQYPDWSNYSNYDQYSMHSSAPSSTFGDSRPGSVIERRSSGAEDTTYNELEELTSDMSLLNRTETPEEQVMQRTTPLSFTRPHVKATFSAIGGLINFVAAKQPLDGEMASVHNVLYRNCVDMTLLERFPGPLVRGESNKKSIKSFITETINKYLPNNFRHNPKELFAQIALWEFMNLLIRQNGTFDGCDVADMLINLLPSVDVQGKETKQLSALANEPKNVEKESLEEFHMFLSTGRTKDGLDIAMSSGMWGHAFMLGATLGERVLSHVQSSYLQSLNKRDPMKTLYGHLRNKDSAYIKKRANPETWVQNLCMIISQVTGHQDKDRENVIAFGDSLRDQGLVAAAHLCYLLAREQFGFHTSIYDRIALIGVEHRPYTHRPACIWAKTFNVQLTEIYQYACSLHDKSFVLPSFQTYKYEHAVKLLEFGYPRQALAYFESISVAIIADETSSLYKPELVNNIIKFSDRILLQEAERYEDKETPEWLESLQRYCQNYRSPTPPQVSKVNNNASGNLGHSSTDISEERVSPEYSVGRSSSSNDMSSREDHPPPSDSQILEDDQGVYTDDQGVYTDEVDNANTPYYIPTEQSDTYSNATENYHNEQVHSQQTSPRYNDDNNMYVPAYEENHSETELQQPQQDYYGSGQYGFEQPQQGDYSSEQHDFLEQPDYSADQSNYAAQSNFYSPNQDFSNQPSYSTGEHSAQETNFSGEGSYPSGKLDYSWNQNQSETGNEYRQPAAQEDYPDEEDLFGGFSKKKSKTDGKEAKPKQKEAPPKTKAATDAKNPSKGWFGSIMSKFSRKEVYLPDDKDKSLVFDDKLQRWVDKNGDEEETNAAPLPPPPTGNIGPPSGAAPIGISTFPPSSGSPGGTPSNLEPRGIQRPPMPQNMQRPPMPQTPSSVISHTNARHPPQPAPAVTMETSVPSVPMNAVINTQEQPTPLQEQQTPLQEQLTPIQERQPSTRLRRNVNRQPQIKENEEVKKPAGPPSKFSMKAQGGSRRGANRYINVMGSATKSTPMAPVLDPMAGLNASSPSSNTNSSMNGNTMPMFFDPTKISNPSSTSAGRGRERNQR